jgi:GNAT superfamily N-acetyltransferase
MDVLVRPLEARDRRAVARLLDDSVGEGFWSFDDTERALGLVAMGDGPGELTGAALCRLEPAGDPDAVLAFGDGGGGGDETSERRVLHVRAIAVAPAARRRGIARTLLAGAEEEAAARGATAAYLFAWLPAGEPEPAAVPFYLAAGFEPRPDIPDFYAAGSLASGAVCPYCGAPPCRCAARPFVKALGLRA